MVRVVLIEVPPARSGPGLLAGQGTIEAAVKAAFADDVAAMFCEQR